MRRLILAVLTPIFLFVACDSGDEGDLKMTGCPGDEIAVEGEAFCVFFEDGSLTSMCPQDFSVGHVINGVVVCSSGQDIPDEAVGDELDRRGLSRPESLVECEQDLDCPHPAPLLACELNVSHEVLAVGDCNEENRCELDEDESYTDCGEKGEVCFAGACLEIPEGDNVEILADEHQACETVDDCLALSTGCGSCAGDCAAVNQAFGRVYTEALVCTNFDGTTCDFDCHPDAGLTQLACEAGVCVITEL